MTTNTTDTQALKQLRVRTSQGKLLYYTIDGQTVGSITSISYQGDDNSVFTVSNSNSGYTVRDPAQGMSVIKLEDAVQKYVVYLVGK